MASTLEKFALEIRHLQRSEVDEVREPFGKKGFVTKTYIKNCPEFG